MTISHNAPFVEAVCNEKWTVRAQASGYGRGLGGVPSLARGNGGAVARVLP